MGFFGSILHGSGGWAFTHRLSLFPTREIMGPEVLFWHGALPPEVEMMLRSHTVLLSLSSAACVGFLGFFFCPLLNSTLKCLCWTRGHPQRLSGPWVTSNSVSFQGAWITAEELEPVPGPRLGPPRILVRSLLLLRGAQSGSLLPGSLACDAGEEPGPEGAAVESSGV